MCNNITCNSQSCLNQIDSKYEDIVESLLYIKNKVKMNKFNIIPGWNGRVK